MDQDDANNALGLVIADTAAVIRDLREEGKTVFLHCVHAQTRTPVVAAAYGALITGTEPEAALRCNSCREGSPSRRQARPVGARRAGAQTAIIQRRATRQCPRPSV